MRARIFGGIIFFCFFALVAALFYTQIIQHDLYTSMSENNRIRAVPLEAPRGKIYDRSGELLVTNRIAFDVGVIYQEMSDKEKVARSLSSILGMDEKALSKKIKEARARAFVPVRIAGDIAKNYAIEIEEMMIDLPGVIVTTRPLRKYIYGNTLSHITGYIGRISEDELKKYQTYGYRIRDYVGKDGLERNYNDYLRGADGGVQIEVDSRGRQRRVLAVKEPRPGKDLHLTIDARLQRFCDSLLSGKNGAIIAMDPKRGDIFALASAANFDPNLFVSSNNSGEISALLGDRENFPLLNRAISSAYPTGSVFKIVISASALEEGLFDRKKTFSCKGSLQLGDRTFHCWDDDGHGVLDILGAIKNSCNVFFYQLGLLVGVELISKYAFKFGLGNPTGIDLPGEAKGLVPTPAWKRRKMREPWYKGETANYSIGQGFLLTTPIQISRLASAVANGGQLVRPFLVSRIEDVALRRAESRPVGLKDETLEAVKDGMREAINAPHGTGLYAKSNEIVIAGKTGTAQNPEGASHAWFAGFAPFDDPAISVVVFIEHGGKGGLTPARFAKEIIEEAKRLQLL